MSGHRSVGRGAPICGERSVAEDASSYPEACRRFATRAGLDCTEPRRLLDDTGLQGLSKATFSDQRWVNAMDYLQRNALASKAADVRELFQEGGKTFGLWWRLSEASISALLPHVLRDRVNDSPASAWLAQCVASLPADAVVADSSPRRARSTRSRASSRPSDYGSSFFQSAGQLHMWSDNYKRFDGSPAQPSDTTNIWWFKLALTVLVGACSVAYAYWLVFLKAPGLLRLFHWPIVLARGAGMGIALFSGVMYLSMARQFMMCCYRLVPRKSRWQAVLDSHRDIHVFTGKALLVTSVLHGVAHLVGSVDGMSTSTPEQLNDVLFCANPNQFVVRWNLVSWLQWPTCPLEKPLTYLEVIYKTTPGVSGIGLVVCLMVIGFSSLPWVRARYFELFWYSHNLAMLLWPILLFVHGCNGWMGIGVPLVVFTCSIPLGLYSIDRIGRALRYYCLFKRGVARVVEAIVRPGKNGGKSGALVHLSISKPPYFWNLEPGMYAFLCMPDYAYLQWHPFTISSGRRDANLEFIISADGDWTEALAKQCLDSLEQTASLPRVAIDGPYPAPTHSALNHDVLVVVGAGVGITPFLSLLATITPLLEEEEEGARPVSLKAAHFFWLTRSLDEFLFGRRHFERIASCPRLRERIHLHLHCTARVPENDAAAYIFREAIRIQSRRDRDVFAKARVQGRAEWHSDISLPWCWMHGGGQDVLWLNGLADHPNDRPEFLGGELTSELALHERRVDNRELRSAISVVIEIPEDLEDSADGTVPPDLPDVTSAIRSVASFFQSLVPTRRQYAKQTLLFCDSGAAALDRGGQGWRRRQPADGGSVQAQTEDESPTSSSGSNCSNSSSCSNGRNSSSSNSSSSGGAWPPPPPTNTYFSSNTGSTPPAPLLPVAFGRPDWQAELPAVAESWPQDDVHVYVCGNEGLIGDLRSVCESCNDEAAASQSSCSDNCDEEASCDRSCQRFHLHYERFG
eukprot:TRINITY_DN7161_c0_g1_i2.p1 TRINITY_DN7161_c0_g1~~TRINITY_DN7161_c0_g1_i2.p1  ORF type:complete len:993 (+),score=120.07 TRINITY_DN7161_c0_g1_i2:68-2980(+)